jgi:hypothetical protein
MGAALLRDIRAGGRMKVTEPTTTATDALLAAANFAMALDLARRPAPRVGRGTYRLWALALGVSGAAAAAGAVSHGSKAVGDGSLSARAWKLALRGSGMTGTLLAAGAAMEQPDTARRARSLASIAVRQATFQGRVAPRAPFRSAVLAYGMDTTSTLRWLMPQAREGERSSLLALGSITLTILGGVVQQAGWGRGTLLNNNDRFHLLQLGSSALLYAAAREIGRSGPRNPSGEKQDS